MNTEQLEELAKAYANNECPIKTEEDYYKDDVEIPYYDYNEERFIKQILLRKAFIAGYSLKEEGAGTWVRASDRLPEKIWPYEVVWRYIDTKRVLDVYSYWTETQLELNDADFLGNPVGTLVLKSQVEWLDESSPTKVDIEKNKP